MFVAQKLRKENIAEYLIYMWQLEDLLRSFNLDIDEVREKYLVRFGNLSTSERQQQEQWYQDIIEMMRSEKIQHKGHLQICSNVLINLRELHQKLMLSDKYPYYHTTYHQALPMIVELRAKQHAQAEHSELESCFELLYGVMLLKMQKRTISEQTQQAVQKISSFIGMLSDYYHKDIINPLEM